MRWNETLQNLWGDLNPEKYIGKCRHEEQQRITGILATLTMDEIAMIVMLQHIENVCFMFRLLDYGIDPHASKSFDESIEDALRVWRSAGL